MLLYSRIYLCSDSYKLLLPRTCLSKSHVYYWCLPSSAPPRKRQHTLNQPFRVCYVGSLGLGYDIETLISAARVLEKFYPGEFYFEIAGGGQKSALFSNNCPSNMIFLGYLAFVEVQRLLQNSNAGILPYVENSAVSIPIKLFDSINNSIPVVSSLSLETRDLMLSHGLGCYYEAGNVQSFVSAILQLRSSYTDYVSNVFSFVELIPGSVFDSSISYRNYASALSSLLPY